MKKKTVSNQVDLVYPEQCRFAFDQQYQFFGKIGYETRSFIEETLLFPPIDGLVHESAYAMCPTDTCFAEYAVLALRCPPIEPLLNWMTDTVYAFVQECPIGNGLRTYNEKKLKIPIKYLKSDKEICDFYVTQLQHVYDGWYCDGEGDHNSINEQAGLLIADCWNSGNLYTFYRLNWYDWQSCGNNVRASYWTVDATTGHPLGLTDFILPEKTDELSALMMPHIVNGEGERLIEQNPNYSVDNKEVIEHADGCALIAEGLIIYFYPYNLGCGADGEYVAVIPYEELYGILKPDLLHPTSLLLSQQ